MNNKKNQKRGPQNYMEGGGGQGVDVTAKMSRGGAL